MNRAEDRRRYFLTPAAGASPRAHLERSIVRGVDAAEIAAYLSPDQRAMMGSRASVRVWGMGATSRDRFNQVQLGDVVLFYTPDNGKKGFNYACELLAKFPDGEPLSKYLWPAADESFPLILILGPPVEHFLPLDEFNAVGADQYETIPNSFLLHDEPRAIALDEFFFSEPQNFQTEFNLRPGDTIKRVALHDAFGGSRQGGISPSLKTRNIFLFSDPKTGLQHGYVDGWRADGCFHYTGEGQRGDQEIKSGNAAILNHKKHNRTLRLFNG